MGVQTRSGYQFKGPGPFVAIVVNTVDTEFNGQIEVSLVKGNSDNPLDATAEYVPCRYLSPFYGQTSSRYLGNDYKDWKQSQQSYGMWMTPPDVGTRVLVVFADGDYSQGFWIGCIPDKYMNYSVPGSASDIVNKTDYTENPETYLTYGSDNALNLPVAEYNRKNPKKDTWFRPIHVPFADTLARQGLLKDNIRGVTSSSARRESPSSVFGINTPGPMDTSPSSPKKDITYGGYSTDGYVNRLGGQSFVMDDGDEDGNNELVRIRTRTGHQILLHNTSDLIYIANAGGTAWIELTGNGKIDIYAQDSVSIHSEQDFNFRADRDINFEAGNNVNIQAFSNINLQANTDLNAFIAQNVKITGAQAVSFFSQKDLSIGSAGAIKMYGGTGLDLIGLPVKISGSDVNIGGQNIVLSAAKIKQNSATAQSANPPTIVQATPLPKFGVGAVNSIMQRIPTKEPWNQHESINPDAVSPLATNSGVAYPNQPPSPNATATITAGNSLIFDPPGTTGDEAHFARCSQALVDAVSKAALEYKSITGNPVKINSSFRSYTEQKKLYDAWSNAGGNYKDRPSVYINGSKISTPVNPDKGQSPHGKGIAIDTNQAADLDRRGLLAKYGLYRPVPATDPQHVQLQAGQTSSVAIKTTVILFKGLQTVSEVERLRANSALETMASQINAEKNFKATVVNWETKVQDMIRSANGPIILVGFSKGAESILTTALSVPSTKINLALFIDGYYTVTLNSLNNSTMPPNIQKAIDWYNPNAFGYNGSKPKSGGRISHKETLIAHADMPNYLINQIVGLVLQVGGEGTE